MYNLNEKFSLYHQLSVSSRYKPTWSKISVNKKNNPNTSKVKKSLDMSVQ